MFCRKCDYPLSQLRSRSCPECGASFDPADPATFREVHRVKFGIYVGAGLAGLVVFSGVLNGLSWLQLFVIRWWHETRTIWWNIAGQQVQYGPYDSTISDLSPLASWALAMQFVLFTAIAVLTAIIAARSIVRWIRAG